VWCGGSSASVPVAQLFFECYSINSDLLNSATIWSEESDMFMLFSDTY
jgi:hypothetical protein